jgi:hypothetical protein
MAITEGEQEMISQLKAIKKYLKNMYVNPNDSEKEN